jgi:hypothetical protein
MQRGNPENKNIKISIFFGFPPSLTQTANKIHCAPSFHHSAFLSFPRRRESKLITLKYKNVKKNKREL